MNRLLGMPIIRPATAEDLPQVMAILNVEIAEGFAHFGTEAMSLDQLESEFEHAGTYPWMVAIEEHRVLGFAKANSWKLRGGYRRTCEVGVYVRPEFQGQGIGRQLYAALLPELKSRGFHTLLGGVSLPNPASVKLHESFGFRHVGTLPQVGWKLDAWRDVGYWALTFPD